MGMHVVVGLRNKSGKRWSTAHTSNCRDKFLTTTEKIVSPGLCWGAGSPPYGAPPLVADQLSGCGTYWQQMEVYGSIASNTATAISLPVCAGSDILTLLATKGCCGIWTKTLW